MKEQIKRIAPVVLTAVVIVIASRFLVQKLFFTPHDENATAAELKEERSEAKGEEGESNHGFYMIKDLIINPANSGGRRHLMVTLGLEYNHLSVMKELEGRDPQIRDNLITLLGGQEIGVLADIRYREKIRASLLKAVNYYLEGPKVEKLYFVEYVFQ